MSGGGSWPGRRRVLVTGGAGFIGANLVQRLVGEGHEVIIYDSLVRQGVRDNLARLKAAFGASVEVHECDVRDADALRRVMRDVDVVYHFAAQVAVTTSLVDPRDDFEVNLRGTVNVLEAARCATRPPAVIFSSTNKVYGDLADIDLALGEHGYRPVDRRTYNTGVGRDRAISFHTPYGCSKGAADQYVLDYARSYGLRTMVLRMSCIYGPWQKGTEDQGWVAHFILRALNGEPLTIYGDGHQVRDILYVADAVEAYMRAFATLDRNAGHVYNLGGGPRNAVSLRQLIAHIETLCERRIELSFDAWRPGDQRYFVTDMEDTRAALDLPTPLDWKIGVEKLTRWFSNDAVAAEAVQ